MWLNFTPVSFVRIQDVSNSTSFTGGLVVEYMWNSFEFGVINDLNKSLKFGLPNNTFNGDAGVLSSLQIWFSSAGLNFEFE